MLSPKTVQDFMKGMYTIHETLGAIILFYPLNEVDTANSIDIYKEKKYATYGEPIEITCTHNISTNEYGVLSNVGNVPEKLAGVVITSYELTQKGITPETICKGKFKVLDREYSITDFSPVSVFSNSVVSYKFSCKGVDVL